MSRPLNTTFDEVADLYDAVRPGYPGQLVDAVDDVLKTTGGRILEIGCGTGQATALFARRGYSVVALEPGPNLASLAASNLRIFPHVAVERITFEEWLVQEHAFNMVMSATAFHWVAPETRYVKSARALRKNGWLALFWNVGANDDSVPASRIQAVYDMYKPSIPSAHPYATHHPTGSATQQNENLSRWVEEIDQSGLFGTVRMMQVPWSQWYTTEQYLQLLETYSDHRSMPPENKRRLFAGIAEVLVHNGDGIDKKYLAILYLAQKR